MNDDRPERPDRAERVRWATAEQQVEAFMDVLMRRYGLKEDDMPELIAALKWAAEYKANLNRLAIAGMVSLLGIVLSGVGVLLWEGLKHYLGSRDGA